VTDAAIIGSAITVPLSNGYRAALESLEHWHSRDDRLFVVQQ
jgi:hypothetical protein